QPRLSRMDAQTLFAPLGPTYERCATILSFGQDPRWRRFLVGRVDADRDSRVLDVATGTGLVARALVARYGCSVVAVDQSAGLPAAGAAIGRGWREAGSFLGGSIRGFDAAWPEERLRDAWRAAGIADVRLRQLSLGGGIVTWGRKSRGAA